MSKTIIPKIYVEIKDKIKLFIKENCYSSSFTTDSWESVSGTNYLSLTSHFLTNYFEIHSILLDI